MRTKRSAINTISSLAYYVISVIVGIINRKALVNILGIEYQGINGLFSNILTMLTIAELGLGGAIIYNLYEPLKNDNRDTIKALMAFYKRCYRIIAIVILGVGLLIIPILPKIIKDYNLPYSLSFIYVWFLADTVVSYFLSYRRSILIADQKNYIVLIVDTIVMTANRLTQVLVLTVTHNFILYLACMVIFRAIGNIVVYCYTNSKYSYLESTDIIAVPKRTLNDILQKVKGALYHKIGTFVVLGTDNILISGFFGLSINGIYSNYYLLINTFQSIITMTLSSITASVGNMLIERDGENTLEVFKETRVLNFLLSCVSSTGIYCLSTKVIGLLFGTSLILDEITVFVLSLNMAIQSMRGTYIVFKEAAGILYEDRYVPIIESVVNIVASIVFLKIFGLAGIFIGTIFSSMVLFGYSYPRFVYTGVLNRNLTEYYRDIIWELSIIVISMLITNIIITSVRIESGWFGLIIQIVLVGIIATGFAITGYLAWKKETKAIIARVRRVLIDSGK